jgi:hypothetical protein
MAIGNFGTSFTPPAPAIRTTPVQPTPPVTQTPKADAAPASSSSNRVDISSETKENGNGLSGYLGKLGETWKTANTTFDLNDKERAQVAKSSGTLQKLAGDDGKWNSDDLADNVQSIKGSFKGGLAGVAERAAGPGIAERGLREGFKEMSGNEVPPLTDAQKSGAEGRWNSKSPEEKKSSTISRKEMEYFQSTMDMIKAKSKEKGLPESKFENGMPANFLSQIAENQPAWMLKLNSMLPVQPDSK